MRKRFFISVILFAMIITAGCGKIIENAVDDVADNENGEGTEDKEVKAEADDKESAAELGDYSVEFSGEVVEQEDQFIIEGKSNLLPGSRVVGEVIVDDGETIYSDTSELVDEDGSFHMELEHHKYGEAEIIVRFDFEGVQEDEIKRHYGEKGQKLEGPFIYKHETFDGILMKAEVRVEYLPEESDLTLAAPDWYELPDDYGDPRIWIEVEDITEDGEFFYVHGRSNILEGSELRVEYQYNRGKTQVNPDGSFDFKFDYEYLEDKDIVITFEPSAFQWNEIEEAYGATGQKLVGNLVVSDKFNTDKQYIEKRIPWDNKSAESSNRDTESEDEEDNINNTDEETDAENEEDSINNTDEDAEEEVDKEDEEKE